MGISIFVEDENGNKIGSILDPTNILHRVLPAYGNPSYKYLNRIDWYGDTTFNHLQLPDLRQEFERLAGENGRAAEELTLIYEILKMVGETGTEPHLYLKFCGD